MRISNDGTYYQNFITRYPMSPNPYPYAAFSDGQERDLMFRQVLAIYLDARRETAKTLADACTALAEGDHLKAKVTVADIRNYMTGSCQPKIDKLTLIARVTNLQFPKLVGYNRQKPTSVRIVA